MRILLKLYLFSFHIQLFKDRNMSKFFLWKLKRYKITLIIVLHKKFVDIFFYYFMKIEIFRVVTLKLSKHNNNLLQSTRVRRICS